MGEVQLSLTVGTCDGATRASAGQATVEDVGYILATITGGSLSTTVTVKLQVDVLEARSVAR